MHLNAALAPRYRAATLNGHSAKNNSLRTPTCADEKPFSHVESGRGDEDGCPTQHPPRRSSYISVKLTIAFAAAALLGFAMAPVDSSARGGHGGHGGVMHVGHVGHI